MAENVIDITPRLRERSEEQTPQEKLEGVVKKLGNFVDNASETYVGNEGEDDGSHIMLLRDQKSFIEGAYKKDTEGYMSWEEFSLNVYDLDTEAEEKKIRFTIQNQEGAVNVVAAYAVNESTIAERNGTTKKDDGLQNSQINAYTELFDKLMARANGEKTVSIEDLWNEFVSKVPPSNPPTGGGEPVALPSAA
jgi:hypothetical protein